MGSGSRQEAAAQLPELSSPRSSRGNRKFRPRASARVTRGLWRTVRLRVEERAPEALLPHRGRLAELDPEGVVLPLGGSRVAGDLPTLTGIDLDTLEFGRKVSEPRVTACVDFLA